MKKLTLSFLLILLSFTSSISIANNPVITVELLSYEQEEDYCKLTYSVSNNTWGTMYDFQVKTEAFDDRGTEMDGYGFGEYMNPFDGFWDPLESIPNGYRATSNNLKFKGQCKYIGTINALKIDLDDCSIRMMPEEANCFDIVEFKSSINHITFRKK